MRLITFVSYPVAKVPGQLMAMSRKTHQSVVTWPQDIPQNRQHRISYFYTYKESHQEFGTMRWTSGPVIIWRAYTMSRRAGIRRLSSRGRIVMTTSGHPEASVKGVVSLQAKKQRVLWLLADRLSDQATPPIHPFPFNLS